METRQCAVKTLLANVCLIQSYSEVTKQIVMSVSFYRGTNASIIFINYE